MGSQQRLTRNSCDASRLEHVHTSDKQWRLTSLEQLCKIKMWKDVRVSWIIYKSELVRVVDRLPVIRKMSGWSLNFLLVLVVLYTSGTPSPSSHHVTQCSKTQSPSQGCFMSLRFAAFIHAWLSELCSSSILFCFSRSVANLLLCLDLCPADDPGWSQLYLWDRWPHTEEPQKKFKVHLDHHPFSTVLTLDPSCLLCVMDKHLHLVSSVKGCCS